MKCWIDFECPFGEDDYGKCFSCFLPNEMIEKNVLPSMAVLEADNVYPEKEN